MARRKESDEEGGKRQRKAAGKHSKRRSKDLVNYPQMHALAKEERVRMLAILVERAASPKEISEELNESLSQVSYHVSVLRECRLIKLDHKAPRPGAVEHFYRATTPTLIPPGAWDGLPPAVRRSVSTCILQEFFDDAQAAMEAGVFDQRPGELSWTPLLLDTPGVERFGELARGFIESVLELQAEVSARLPKGKEAKAKDVVSATVFLASFLSARSSRDGVGASATRRPS